MSSISSPANKTDPAQRYFVRNRVLVVLVSLGALLLPFVYAPHVAHGPVLCPLHGLAGLPCPACGLTRAFCALSQLDVGQAVRLNALCVPLLCLFLAAPLVALLELARGTRCRFYGFLYSSTLAHVLGSTVIVYHLARVACWACDGTLYTDYIRTSWTHQLIRVWFG